MGNVNTCTGVYYALQSIAFLFIVLRQGLSLDWKLVPLTRLLVRESQDKPVHMPQCLAFAWLQGFSFFQFFFHLFYVFHIMCLVHIHFLPLHICPLPLHLPPQNKTKFRRIKEENKMKNILKGKELKIMSWEASV